jgi:hypothetical protein
MNNKGIPPPALLEIALISGLSMQAVLQAVAPSINICFRSSVVLQPIVKATNIASTIIFILLSPVLPWALKLLSSPI